MGKDKPKTVGFEVFLLQTVFYPEIFETETKIGVKILGKTPIELCKKCDTV